MIILKYNSRSFSATSALSSVSRGNLGVASVNAARTISPLKNFISQEISRFYQVWTISRTWIRLLAVFMTVWQKTQCSTETLFKNIMINNKQLFQRCKQKCHSYVVFIFSSQKHFILLIFVRTRLTWTYFCSRHIYQIKNTVTSSSLTICS